MKISKEILLLIMLTTCIFLFGCIQKIEYKSGLLKVSDLIDISVSAPEGSGSIRTLTIRYKHDGREESASIDNVKRIDLSGYDDEKKEQTFTTSDYNGDGIFDIIVYREFWFPDPVMSHPDVPEWPAVYEFDINKGYVIASAKYEAYFEKYAAISNEQLTRNNDQLSDAGLLALKRLIYAARKVEDGSFTPQSQYNGQYYEDVYELTKDIVQ